MMNSAIGAEIEDQCPQSLPTEKRKHAEVGDGSPLSEPIPPEKRNCVEIVEQPPESLQRIGEQNLSDCEGQEEGEDEIPTFDELPPHVQKRLLRFKEMFGPDWPKSGMGSHHNRNISDELIGDLGNFYEDEDQKENSQPVVT